MEKLIIRSKNEMLPLSDDIDNEKANSDSEDIPIHHFSKNRRMTNINDSTLEGDEDDELSITISSRDPIEQRECITALLSEDSDDNFSKSSSSGFTLPEVELSKCSDDGSQSGYYSDSEISSMESARDDLLANFHELTQKEKLNAIESGDYAFIILRGFKEKNYFQTANNLEFVIAYALDIWNSEKFISKPLQIISKLYGTLIECYAEMEQWEKMRRTSLEYLNDFPELQSPYCSLAWSQRKLHRHEDCIKACTKGLTRFPSCENLYNIRANAYYDKKMFRLATKDFHKAIEVSRQNIGAPAGVSRALKSWCK